jgi:multiple sugar transport system permease protein
VLAVMGGYALSRYRFRGRSLFMVVLLCTQFIPGAMMLIPLFTIFKSLHLINSLGSLIVADTVFNLPLSIILMSGFVTAVPFSVEEAAMVDGCTRLRAFLAVVLPQLRPGLIAVGSFAFIHTWNNFLFALMFVSRQDGFTIPVGLSYTIGEYSADFGALAAGGVVAALPVVCVFAVVQRYLVRGISAGAVKG